MLEYSRMGMKPLVIHSPEELGSALRARRKEGGLTIAEVADMVGCSPRYISELERGKAGASLRLLLSLMNELGLQFTLHVKSS